MMCHMNASVAEAVSTTEVTFSHLTLLVQCQEGHSLFYRSFVLQSVLVRYFWKTAINVFLQYYCNSQCFLLGESIAISAEFENYSSRTVVPYATLHQTQMFFANGKTRIRDTKFTVLTGVYHLFTVVAL